MIYSWWMMRMYSGIRNKYSLRFPLVKAVGLCSCCDLDDKVSPGARLDYTYEGACSHQPSVHRLNVRMARAPWIEPSGCIACDVRMSRLMRASDALIRRC